MAFLAHLLLNKETVTKTPRMHQNSPFWEPKSKNFLGRGIAPSPGGEGDTPSPHHSPLGSILAPAALAWAPRSSSPHWFCLQIPPWWWDLFSSLDYFSAFADVTASCDRACQTFGTSKNTPLNWSLIDTSKHALWVDSGHFQHAVNLSA